MYVHPYIVQAQYNDIIQVIMRIKELITEQAMPCGPILINVVSQFCILDLVVCRNTGAKLIYTIGD